MEKTGSKGIQDLVVHGAHKEKGDCRVRIRNDRADRPINTLFISGPRGRQGKEGNDGKPGAPGISLWKVEDTESETSMLLIPPKISGGQFDDKQKIIVKEADHLKLTCAASGIPKPIVTWRKKDGNAFPDGSWRSNLIG